MSCSLKVSSTPSQDLVFTNCVFIHPSTPIANNAVIDIGRTFAYVVQHNVIVPPGSIALNTFQRRLTRTSLNDPLDVELYVPEDPQRSGLDRVTFEIDFVTKGKSTPKFDIDSSTLSHLIKKQFLKHVFSVQSVFAVDFEGTKFTLTCRDLDVIDLSSLQSDKGSSKGNQRAGRISRGALINETEITFTKPTGSTIQIKATSSSGGNQIFRPDFNFEQIGIGGLDQEFSDIFRRAFASRIFPSSIIEKLGIKHVRGIMLFGPPGCGKTLIARQIGRMLNCVEPKIVNGPEILNKFVGQSEENIRELFSSAEKEFKERGDDSDLHLIIFDEIDAICRQRGTVRSGTGVHDSIVNQLLSKMDGVDQLNNVLVIGMTNRKDLIDEALLRPGRFEVHMEIGLPDVDGRLQILKIHTMRMRDNNLLGDDVDLQRLAEVAKNFSGAELEGLVRSATSFAFNRQVDPKNPTKPLDVRNIKVVWADFENALEEITPSFGVTQDDMKSYCSEGIIPYGYRYDHLVDVLKTAIDQLRTSDRTHLLTILLEGTHGAGKTALAAKAALDSEFPFIKVITSENMIGFSEGDKVDTIAKNMLNAHKSPLSILLLDDIERLIEYVGVGPRFSNVILQTIFVLLKKKPPQDRKLLIIGTTSSVDALRTMELPELFNIVLTVPSLDADEMKNVLQQMNAFANEDDLSEAVSMLPTFLPIKKLLLVAEMARRGDPHIQIDNLESCLLDLKVKD